MKANVNCMQPIAELMKKAFLPLAFFGSFTLAYIFPNIGKFPGETTWSWSYAPSLVSSVVSPSNRIDRHGKTPVSDRIILRPKTAIFIFTGDPVHDKMTQEEMRVFLSDPKKVKTGECQIRYDYRRPPVIMIECEYFQAPKV